MITIDINNKVEIANYIFKCTFDDDKIACKNAFKAWLLDLFLQDKLIRVQVELIMQLYELSEGRNNTDCEFPEVRFIKETNSE
jgi:hypothetical protein